MAGGRRPGQLGADGGGEVPVDGAADGDLRGRAHGCTRTIAASAANASIAVRPVGPALLEISANVSTRPLASVTMPPSELVPVSDPVLARSHPTARGRRRCRGSGWTACRCRLRSAAGPPAASAWAGRVAGGGVDHLVERLRGQPVVDGQAAASPSGVAPPVSIFAESSWPSTALHRAVEALRLALARRRPRGRSTRPSRCRSRSSSRAAVRSAAATAPRRSRRRRDRRGQHRDGWPGRRPARLPARGPRRARACSTGAESTLTGWVRPPSSITASIGAMSPPSMSSRIPAGRHRRAAEGADVDLHRRHLDAAARTWSARSLMRAASRYQVSCARAAPPTASGRRRP